MTTSGSANRPAGAGLLVAAGGRDGPEPWRGPWPAVQVALPAVRDLQSAALEIYGRLESDRALVWTMEELGELAQAVRRQEGPARLEEELGQLTAWMLCLANILRVDLAAALQAAIEEEIGRQLAKYGALRPYPRGQVAR
jgi:NTP pyrophosphatase (non-canonical NTP hydrolase)